MTDRAGSLRRELPGLSLLVVALAFGCIALAPELRIGILAPNDSVYHLAAAERLADSWRAGEPFLDAWVSEWALGYPLWRTYQPLPHAIAAAVLQVTAPRVDAATAFAALQYALLVLLPASAYCGARFLGLGPGAAGLLALLILAPAATGEPGRYGLGYGATVYRGSGLFTQLVAVHFFLFALGLARLALDTGRWRSSAALALAATALSHIVLGYVGFVSIFLLAVVGPAGERSRRLVRLATVAGPALLLLLWFVVPLLLSAGEVNHSRWEDSYKWDSFGAGYVLTEIAGGRFFDGDRLPVLSLFVGIGVLVVLVRARAALPRRLLVLGVFWLFLFFGRSTWGHLLLLVGVPADLHLHRVQVAVELMAVLIAAWGLAALIGRLAATRRVLFVPVLLAVAAGVIVIGEERAGFLAVNGRWGETNLQAHAAERDDLDNALEAVRSILADGPGRVSAGKAATWGREFKVGANHVYSFLSRRHLDQVSFLYHSMSLTSDVMVLRHESDGAHDVAFGVRAVLAPADRAMPGHLRLRGVYGRFAVYEASREGYFGLVDVGGHFAASRSDSDAFELHRRWLESAWLRAGVVVAMDESLSSVPEIAAGEPLPPTPAELRVPRGRIVEEEKIGELYRARVELVRPSYVFVKLTYHPDLLARVDGTTVPLLRVSPGFGAVAVPAGAHTVEVVYRPGPLKPVLFAAGFVLFAFVAVLLRRRRMAEVEAGVAAWLGSLGGRLATPRSAVVLALLLLGAVALRPLARGQLVDGHDALEYPPRLVEMARAVADGHLPPLWAPDLGAGYGQPLFEFAPPLLYAVAWVPLAVGLGLADALQLGLAFLFLAGAAAMYGLGRRFGGGRTAAVAGAGAWLFAPYTTLDLYVRAAFAEAAAVAVAPLALLGVLAAADRPTSRRIAVGAFAVALIPLAHNGAALLFVPALAAIAVAGSPQRRLPGMAVVLLGLGVAAFVWLPAFAEKGFVKTDLLRALPLDWRLHLVSPWQLLWSPWGHGLSLSGTGDGMSFQLGPLHLVLALAGLLLMCTASGRARRKEAIVFAVVAFAGAWLATSWARPVWARVENLQYLVYPWRALMLPGLFLPLLCVPAFERLGRRGCLVAGALLVAFNLPHTEPKGYVRIDDADFAPRSIAERGINTTTREEYEPRWVVERPPYRKERLVGGWQPLEIREQAIRVHRQEFVVRSPVDQLVEASTFYYPGWTVLVDDRTVDARPLAVRGTLFFRVPAGEHRVVLELRSTPVRRMAGLASAALGVFLLLALALPGTFARTGRFLERRARRAARLASRAFAPLRRHEPGRLIVPVLLLGALALVAWIRMLPLSLGELDDRAELAARQSVQRRMAAALPQNLPRQQLQQDVARWTRAWIGENPDEFERQRTETAEALKSRLRFEGEDGREHVYLGDFDSYGWLRYARNRLETGSPCDAVVDDECRDMMTNAPVGRTSAYAELLHPAALVSVHRLITFFRPGYPLSASAFWLPVIVATLGVIPAFAVGRRLAGNLGGVFAAVLVGVDATVLRRTVGTGKGDKSRFRRPLVPRVWEPNVTPLVDLTGQPVRAPTLPQTGLQP